LTVEACKIVQQEIANNNITKFTKNDGAPVTTTDYKIQIMLNEGIRKMWPNLKIVGE
jgi:3'-phosphoadenosine 5'-phosphosulfate (PAPS) 3'-phosphatase